LAKTIATIGGFNWILVDAEHGQITDKDYYDVSCVPPALSVNRPDRFFTS
jgi:2-keto-3-deoxy-L-rhamnonate aldolase RhmA